MTKTIPKRRMVVDNNFLQHEDLRTYLNASGPNYAVLNEFVSIDVYKKNPLRSVPISSQILCEFPRQVIVLKGSEITQLYSMEVANPQLRLIDRSQTEGFPEFCRALTRASLPSVQDWLLQLSQYADQHMTVMEREAVTLAGLLPELRADYTEAEFRILAAQEPIPDELGRKIIRGIMILAADRLARAGIRRRPSFDEALDTLIFREQMCLYIWVLLGFQGTPVSNTRRIRHDVIDAVHVAYATFFDGLLSKDHLPNQIYAVARNWLDVMVRANRR